MTYLLLAMWFTGLVYIAVCMYYSWREGAKQLDTSTLTWLQEHLEGLNNPIPADLLTHMTEAMLEDAAEWKAAKWVQPPEIVFETWAKRFRALAERREG